MAKLIKDSTSKQRQLYIDQLFQCQNGDCENCGVCKVFAGTSPQQVYQDYIDGKREFNELNQLFNQRKF